MPCSNTKDCIYNDYCDTNLGYCEPCLNICDPAKGLQNICKQECPEFDPARTLSSVVNTIKSTTPSALLQENQNISNSTIALITFLVVLCIVLMLLAVVLICMVQFKGYKYLPCKEINQNNTTNNSTTDEQEQADNVPQDIRNDDIAEIGLNSPRYENVALQNRGEEISLLELNRSNNGDNTAVLSTHSETYIGSPTHDKINGSSSSGDDVSNCDKGNKANLPSHSHLAEGDAKTVNSSQATINPHLGRKTVDKNKVKSSDNDKDFAFSQSSQHEKPENVLLKAQDKKISVEPVQEQLQPLSHTSSETQTDPVLIPKKVTVTSQTQTDEPCFELENNIYSSVQKHVGDSDNIRIIRSRHIPQNTATDQQQLLLPDGVRSVSQRNEAAIEEAAKGVRLKPHYQNDTEAVDTLHDTIEPREKSLSKSSDDEQTSLKAVSRLTVPQQETTPLIPEGATAREPTPTTPLLPEAARANETALTSPTPPTNVHPNRRIYDLLKSIRWVQGYYSEGKSIEVYIDFSDISPRIALDELVRITGEAPEKFKVKENEPIEYQSMKFAAII